jgi:hypothetical protein
MALFAISLNTGNHQSWSGENPMRAATKGGDRCVLLDGIIQHILFADLSLEDDITL